MISTAKRPVQEGEAAGAGASHIYLHNGSLCLESITAKIHHPKYPDDAVGVVVKNIRANVSLMKTGKKVLCFC
jgi:hypothetical protein